ncbi:ATP-binding protein [Dorea amylophila]|uniref:AAA family ATPase n=1 Tax=Dorea amylophila TaxID=2981789 RepID=UPI0022E1ED6A|nr:ATP-binding protein [Dorea amylophila]
MENLFITNIKVNKVRHLKDFEIDLSEQKAKHLILTGKNGCGKTSLLDAMATFLDSILGSNDLGGKLRSLEANKKILKWYQNNDHTDKDIEEEQKSVEFHEELIKKMGGGVMLEMNCPLEKMRNCFEQGQFIAAYYKADRVFTAEVPKYVEKIELKSDYAIDEAPRENFIKYLLDLKMTQALAITGGKTEKAEQIKDWFDKFQGMLQQIFEDDSVKLEFDEDTFKFRIVMDNREPFDFNTLSSGYAAILDIVVDLIIRMEKQTNKVFDFSIPGVVLIDEIESHLHLALQKNIIGLLTTIFPNVQFIVSTHSPFVLNSLEDVTIYDLEQHLEVKNGLADVPYAGIVEGYFNADSMSETLRDKYKKYQTLVKKKELTDDDFEEIADLEMYLDEIPDYLALNITTEYQRLKAELRNRGDI